MYYFLGLRQCAILHIHEGSIFTCLHYLTRCGANPHSTARRTAHDTMLDRPLLLCLPLLIGRSGAQFTMVKPGSAKQCAQISAENSNVWADHGHGQVRWKFDIHIKFPLDPDMETVGTRVRVWYDGTLKHSLSRSSLRYVLLLGHEGAHQQPT